MIARLTLFGCAFVLTACVGPDGSMMFPDDPGMAPPAAPGYANDGPAPYPGAPTYSQPSRPGPVQAPPPARSDYLPHLRDEYRSGFQIGAQDRSYGYPNDYRRAYQRFGGGYESYFQEGYADGYSGSAMRH